MKIEQSEKLVNLSAKVPKDVRDYIEERAKKEQRSLSQVVAILLSSHPLITPKTGIKKAV